MYGMSRGLLVAALVVAFPVLSWIVVVLLLTRQTDLLLILMSCVSVLYACLIFYAWKIKNLLIFVIAFTCLVLAASLAGMALVDILEPDRVGLFFKKFAIGYIIG